MRYTWRGCWWMVLQVGRVGGEGWGIQCCAGGLWGEAPAFITSPAAEGGVPVLVSRGRRSSIQEHHSKVSPLKNPVREIVWKVVGGPAASGHTIPFFALPCTYNGALHRAGALSVEARHCPCAGWSLKPSRSGCAAGCRCLDFGHGRTVEDVLFSEYLIFKLF